MELLRRLVAFDTTSRNSNLELIDFVRGYLSGHGIDSHLTYDVEETKANLFATLGPADVSGGIVLSGHTDVVPVDGQNWDTDPFELTEVNGRFFGRGTADMKTFVAVCLAMVPEFLKRNLGIPIHLALSYDEEVGLIGGRRLVADMVKQGLRPDACIVGEPTGMQVVIAHKGKRSYRCHVRGLEAHSSLAPKGVNAVEYAAALIAFLQGMARCIRDDGPYDHDYDIAHTTVHVGLVRGGTALNIVPTECFFDFEIRHLPQDDPEELFAEIKSYAQTKLLPDMQTASPETGITFTPLATIPILDTDENQEIVQLAKAFTGETTIHKVAYNCEAGLFHQAAVPTVVCGPGNIEQAHKPNEFIEIKQIALCEAFMKRLLDYVSDG
jgi:acetylornithine deacetylase